MKTLITGSTGKLGKELSAFFDEKSELVFVDRISDETRAIGASYQVDLANPGNSLEEIISAERPDVILHLAALLVPACESNPELAYMVNTEATAQLARLAAKYEVSKFVFASTSAIYRQTELTPTDEQSNIDPRSVYAKTKLDAERMIAEAAKGSKTDFTALRMFNIYGPGFTDSLVYKLIHSTANEPVGLVGPETFYRDYVHVHDVVAAFDAAVGLHRQGGTMSVMNIGSGVATNNESLVSQLREQGVEPHYTMRTIDLNVSWSDISLAKMNLGFNPKTAIIAD